MLRDVLDGRVAARSSLAGLLEPVAAYDRQKGTELLPTLQALFAGENSPIEAARQLGVHRHTIDYRLRRIEQILGLSVRTQPDRLAVELALFARGFLGTTATRGG